MRGPKTLFLTGMVVAVALAGAACGPTAEPTATVKPQSTGAVTVAATATTAATPTTAAATATTRAAAVATATVAEAKVRPLPVLAMPPANPLAQKGGVFRTLNSREPEDFAAWESASGTVLAVGIVTTDSLLDRNEFEAGKSEQILANVAYDWWTDAKGTTWTFKLKEGVKFHDGKGMTCADAEFSLETIRDGRDATGATLRRSPRGAWLRRVTDIRCADDHTLVMTTDGPLASLPASLAVSSFSVMPKHVFEGHLQLTQTQAWPGIGPWMFEERKPTEYIKYKRNPDYWNKPYPYLDSYQFISTGSNTAAQAAMRVGRAETGATFPRATTEELIAQGKVYQPVKGVSDGFLGYQANWTREPWKDPRFSLALRCAMDSAKEIKTGEDGNGFEGPAFPLAKDEGGSEWAITEEEWKAVHPCHGPSGDEVNMEKRRQIARDLMGQMGFTAQNPAKPTSYREGTDRAWESLLEDLAKVYIVPQVRAVTNPQRYDIQTNADADILQQGFVTSRRDPDHWLYEQYYSKSDRNYGRYANAEVDALIDKQSKTLDKVERKKIINQIEKILLKDNAKIVVRHSQNNRIFATWVNDIYWGEPGNSQNTSVKLARVWIDQAKMKQVLGQ